MKALFRLLILAPVAVLIVLLAMANRAFVTLSLDPLGGDALTFTLPLFVVLLGAVMLGIVVGGVASWLGQHKHRKAARQNRREAERLKAEIERLRQMLPPTAALSSDP